METYELPCLIVRVHEIQHITFEVENSDKETVNCENVFTLSSYDRYFFFTFVNMI